MKKKNENLLPLNLQFFADGDDDKKFTQDYLDKLINQTIKKERDRQDEMEEQYRKQVKDLKTELEEKTNSIDTLQKDIKEKDEKLTSISDELNQLNNEKVFNEAVQSVEAELGEKVSPSVKKLVQLKGINEKEELVKVLKEEVEEDKNYFEAKVKEKNLVYMEDDETDEVNGTIPSGKGEELSFQELLKQDRDKALDKIIDDI